MLWCVGRRAEFDEYLGDNCGFSKLCRLSWPVEDAELLVLAHRYLYYCLGRPVISDREYDRLERAALTNAAPESPLNEPGSDAEGSYGDTVKALAASLRELEAKGKA